MEKKLLAATIAMMFGTSSGLAADVLPVGGTIVGGTGSVGQNGGAMTINQSSGKLAIDWQSFSIGQGNSVRFVQPSASAVALNRVLGSDVSVIQGALTANGQVFLVNPNGVLFTPTAQVNVGGIVASTLNIGTADFMAGSYRFEGASPNAIVNQGNITAASGGTIALIAAKITNQGTLTADRGNVLLGAGSKVRLDLGGPVKLEVEQGAIDALIEQGGAIRADGGLVYLSARAAGDITSTVINHTGVIEARTLATGEKGEIYLLGDMQRGRIAVGGTLDASAPDGGDGGFIETSAAVVQMQNGVRITAASAQGAAGAWLLDPTDITIGATGCTGTNCVAADTISSVLSGGTDVSIATSAAGSEAGNINVDAPISWAARKLTLSAHNDINVNATLNATGTGSLAFEYGLASANGGASTYTVADAAKIYIPLASSFTWKKGSSGSVRNLVFDNGLLRFGNGTQTSINSNGQLEQPFYFDNTSVVNGSTRNGWYQLTFSNYPLDLEVGLGGDGASSWNRNGELLNTQTNLAAAVSSRSLEISKYKEGTGSIVSAVNLGFGSGASLKVENTYTLAAGASYLKTDTTLTNLGAGAASNVRLWVGTRDDYIATRDSQYKFKGNLTENGFEAITQKTEQSKALKITEFNDGQGAAVLFYSTSEGADTSLARCCSFTNATGIDPRTSEIFRGISNGNPSPEDGSYALFMRLPDLATGRSSGMTWYYAAGPVATLNSIVAQVQVSVAAATPPTAAPAPQAAPIQPPLNAAVRTAQQAGPIKRDARSESPLAVVSGPAPAASSDNRSMDVIGGLEVVHLRSGETNGENARAANQPLGDLKVLVVDGGLNLTSATPRQE